MSVITGIPSPLPDTGGETPPLPRSRRIPTWLQILWANRKSRIGLILLSLFILVAIFAPWLTPYNPQSTAFAQGLGISLAHPLGTTNNGQDVFSQLIYGTRTSVIVGLLAGSMATVIALIVGMLAGYLQGWVDEVLSFFINVAIVIPVLPLMITLAAYAPVKGLTLIIVVIGVTSWAGGARLKRSQIITLRMREYITAARFAGDGTLRIVFREILPNMTSLVVAAFMGTAAGAVGAEAGLEFLGLGDPSTISWGTMMYWAETNDAILADQWGWLIAPGLAIALLITALTLVNFGVDALSNPSLRER
jgi:peptide/nickel transport system permease protein